MEEKPKDLENSQVLDQEREDNEENKLEAEKLETALEKETVPKITEDPDFLALQEEITRRTNLDPQVQGVMETGRDYMDTWDRVNHREYLRSLDNFVDSQPEKSSVYIDKWQGFVKENPELGEIDADGIKEWCRRNDSLGLYYELYNCRQLALAFEFKKKKEQTQLAEKRRREEEKVNELRKDLGAERQEENTDVTSQTLEKVSSVGYEAVLSETPENKLEITEREEKALENLPFLSEKDVHDLLWYEKEDGEYFEFVPTESVIGSASPFFTSWASEYGTRAGRAKEVALNLKSGDRERIENIFHFAKPSERIKLLKIEGPKGPVYFVKDGNHRVSGVKLAELRQMPAEVKGLREISEAYTEDEYQKDAWREMIKGGLIEGEIEEIKDEKGKISFKLKISKALMPWAILPGANFFKINKIYESLLPGSLEGLKSLKDGKEIPAQVFKDSIAMNYYLAGRWEEYLKLKSQTS